MWFPFLAVLLDALNDEGQCLLEFKRNLDDQFGKLISWMSMNENPCNWKGVNCVNGTSNPRVWSLDLADMNWMGACLTVFQI